MAGKIQGQRVLSAGDLGLVAVGPVNHFVGSTATVITKPSGSTVLVLDSEAGDFRYKPGHFSDAELITNGDFAAADGWTLEGGWSIAAGVASCDASQTAETKLSQTLETLIPGTTYSTSITVTNRTAGTVKIVVGGTDGTDRSTNATHAEDVVAGAGEKVEIEASVDFDGDIDDVTVTVKSTEVLTAAAPSATDATGKGSIKVRADKPIALAAPDRFTVIGSSGTDVLTYYWQ